MSSRAIRCFVWYLFNDTIGSPSNYIVMKENIQAITDAVVWKIEYDHFLALLDQVEGGAFGDIEKYRD